MTSVHIRANCFDVPIRVCQDARLRDREGWDPFSSGPLLSRTDQLYGQAGWHIGLEFVGLDQLAEQLERLVLPDYVTRRPRPIRRGELRRLAINTHGNKGVAFVAGYERPRDVPLHQGTFSRYHAALHRIGLLTPRDGTGINLMGCIAGQDREGTELLLRLSRIWPNRRVVGFISVGYAAGGEMWRRGAHCTEPGMRDTRSPHSAGPGSAQERAWGSRWRNLRELPWASEHSPSAKVALNGELIRGAHFDVAPDAP